jgi:hypothetical protein
MVYFQEALAEINCLR